MGLKSQTNKEKLLSYLQNSIKSNFSSDDLYYISKNDRSLFTYFLKEKMITNCRFITFDLLKQNDYFEFEYNLNPEAKNKKNPYPPLPKHEEEEEKEDEQKKEIEKKYREICEIIKKIQSTNLFHILNQIIFLFLNQFLIQMTLFIFLMKQYL